MLQLKANIVISVHQRPQNLGCHSFLIKVITTFPNEQRSSALRIAEARISKLSLCQTTNHEHYYHACMLFAYIYIYTHTHIWYLYVSRHIVFLEKPNPFYLLYFRCFSNIFPLGCDVIKKTWLVESKVIPAYTVKTTVLGNPHKFSSLAKKIGFASITGIIP